MSIPFQRPVPAPLILIVEDHLDTLDLYREHFIYRGYRVATATNGREALELANAQRPDIIMMDLEMPLLSGTEALQLLRDQAAFANMPILAVTAHAMPDERRRIALDGFDEVICKPCLPNDLVKAVERLIRVARANQTNSTGKIDPSP